MTDAGFLQLKSQVFRMLKALDPKLKYHNPLHTEDVIVNAERIAHEEKITDSRILLLIKVAALFHDTGFLDIYVGHEERSCEIFLETIGPDDFTQDEIDLVQGMIMATKVPQSARTEYQKIICDADLDYLGREDFPVIIDRLKEEWRAIGKITDDEDEWNQIQIDFLETHSYFTNSSIKDRNPGKLKQLALLKKKVKVIKP